MHSIILADGVLSGALEVGRAVQAAVAFTTVLRAVAAIVDSFESVSRFVAGVGWRASPAVAVPMPGRSRCASGLLEAHAFRFED